MLYVVAASWAAAKRATLDDPCDTARHRDDIIEALLEGAANHPTYRGQTEVRYVSVESAFGLVTTQSTTVTCTGTVQLANLMDSQFLALASDGESCRLVHF